MLSFLSTGLGSLAAVSLGVQLWQFFAALRFPLHRRDIISSPLPGVSILKPLKGCDLHTRACLESWFDITYPGPFQILFGVHDPADQVCETVRSIIAAHPNVDARLVICPEKLGINAKVSTLIQLRREAIHPVLIVSDADVKIQNGVLASLVAPLDQPHVGLVNCFYRLANPTTVAMKWEAVCINVDFWSQVLQSITLKPQDFALGAAMSFRNTDLAQIGGFEGLADHLADDYQLGHRLARQGLAVQLATTVVECWDSPADWAAVWSHQLRWNRTIRVCQPGPYAASIVANLTLWTGLWCVSRHDWTAVTTLAGILGLRMVLASILARRISRGDRVDEALALGLLAPLKDVLGGAVWLAALFGHRVIWRGVAYTVQADGRLIPAES